MSSDGGDEAQSPSAFLEAPSSQSVIVDAKPIASRSRLERSNVDSFGQDSSEEERENGFNGPASTWRDYTADERGLIASLDQERASDLSVHLYNAHALKSRLYDPNGAAASQSWNSKHRWIKPGDDGAAPWYPDANWTAWPLHADDVPRKSEGFGKDVLVDDTVNGTLKMHVPWRAGADLDDEVVALMLRKAKDRFTLRAKAQKDPPSRQPSINRSPSRMHSSPPSGSASRRSSVASEHWSHASDSEVDGTEVGSYSKPEFMLDDDKISSLLSQSSRHILTKFDELLMGLHRSRRYRTSGSRENSVPAAKPRPQKRKRRSTTNETPAPLARQGSSGVEDGEERASGRDYTKHPSGNNALNPRDWSEVLGIASMTGWNPAVIDRAAKRCSALFGETMLLRTMPETAASKAADKLAEYMPDMVPDFDTLDGAPGTEVEDELQDDGESGFRCPEATCTQHNRLYEKRFEIRQHLRRVHKYDPQALDAYDQACAPPDAKPSTEQLETDERNSDDESSGDDEESERRESMAAVATDGYMKPIALKLGRGTDVQDRKRRGEGKSSGET
jgi:hypothetical protein